MAIKPKSDEAGSGIPEAPAAAINAGYQAVDSGFHQSTKGVEQTVSALKEGMSQAAVGFEKTQARMKEGMEKAMKTAEEFVAFGQGNVEAFMKSGQIWVAGVQDLSKQVAATAQASFEETMSTIKAITSAKSLKDAFDLQANLARSTMEKAISESGRLTDASFKLTEQTLAPITARVTLAVETFAKPV
jgi:phasin family protein